MGINISYENLRNFAYSNDRLCAAPIKGIVLSFFGLGGQDMFGGDTEQGEELARRGIALLIPYTNPWCWMNRQAVQFTDKLVTVLTEKYTLPDTLPIVSSGGSMGGLSALVYARYAARTPAACVVNCPVCDLAFHYTERPDLPRTIHSAFSAYPESLEDAIRTASPLHLADEMPDIPYYLFHCDEDTAVGRADHSDRFADAMRRHRRVTYHTVPGRGHCDLTEDMRRLYNDYIINSIVSHYAE